MIRRLRLLAKAVAGREPWVLTDVRCPMERFGTEYGGWEVAVGTIDAHSVVYSFGVGEDASFDTALIDRFGLTVHAFDPTPKSIAWVRQQGFSERFVLHPYGVAAFDGSASFHPPENPEHVSHTLLSRPSTEAQAISVPMKRLGTIMRELGHDRIDLLKMDIEGAEYEVIEDLGTSGIRPGQVLVEFHHRFAGVGVRRTTEAVRRLRGMGYRVFSISRTNEEFCFIHRPD